MNGQGCASVGRKRLRRACSVRMVRLRIAVAALAFAAAAPRPLPAQDGAAVRREVVELAFEGAESFRAEQLRTAIETRESGCNVPVLCYLGIGRDVQYLENPAILRADVIRLRYFYSRRGYREARISVDTIPFGSGLRVVFRIEEGRPVRVATLEVDGAAGFLPDGIVEQLPLRRGDPLNLIVVEATRDSLISAMRNRGYPRADVLIDRIFIPNESLDAEVRYVVIPGTHARFGTVEITGRNRISEDVIRRMLTFREGDIYRQDALISSQRNLYGLNVFQNVSIQPLASEASDTIIPVRVQVNEGDIHRIRLGAGANNLDCINAEGSWTSRNFLGGARRLEVRGVVTNVFAQQLFESASVCEIQENLDPAYRELSGSLSADFTQPWFLGPRNTLGAGVFIERRSLPGVFIREARGGYLSITRSISSRTSLGLGFRPELTELNATGGEDVFCMTFTACPVDQVEILGRKHWLNPVTLSFARDRTNSVFFPSRGYVMRLETEYASSATGSEFAFVLAAGDLSGYVHLGHGVILASRLRGGWARSIDEPGTAAGLGLHPQKRFFAGGANSVRGFAQYRLGPKVLHVDSILLTRPVAADGGGAGCTEAEVASGTCDPGALGMGAFDVRPVGGDLLLEGSVELRFPLFGDTWRGAAFVDFGQVWQRAAEDGVDPDVRLSDVVASPGVGIRYRSPIGPIRIDVGYNAQANEMLPVVTTVDGRLRFQQPYSWDLGDRFWNWDRLQFHFSIGQAF
ncbi:MAG TPA: BamA/TamA family outer membrane protein [Longimicrobiales bacterium]